MSVRFQLALVLSLGGCGSPVFDGLEVTARGGGWSQHFEDRFTIVHGQAVIVRVRPMSATGPAFQPYDIIELRGGDRDVVEVLAGRTLDEHVLLGVAIGHTDFEAYLGGEHEADLTVFVQAQPEGDD